MDLPNQPGTYILAIPVDAALTITPGKLGTVTLPPATYLYVGSAHGPGGLRARVGRHLRSDKRLHWHIDALTTAATVTEVWYRVSPDRLECKWASELLARPGASIPVPGFGASDCGCVSHLIGFGEGIEATRQFVAVSSNLYVIGRVH